MEWYWWVVLAFIVVAVASDIISDSRWWSRVTGKHFWIDRRGVLRVHVDRLWESDKFWHQVRSLPTQKELDERRREKKS